MKIHFVEIPKTNGHEQSGFRPVLLVSQPISEISLIIPFTANVLALRFPYTLKIEPSPKNGLSFPSVLLIFSTESNRLQKIGKDIGPIRRFLCYPGKRRIEKNVKN